MEIKLYNKSCKHLNRVIYIFLIMLFYPMLLIGVIQSTNNFETSFYMTFFVIITSFLGVVVIKTEQDAKKNIIILTEKSIEYQGTKRAAFCHFDNIAYIVISFVNINTPIIMIVSIKGAYKALRNGNHFPHQRQKVYTHTQITNDFIFFTYNKEAFEMIKKHCAAPIYDEYLLYKKGIEDAL